MSEAFLQFIWQYGLFDQKELKTTDGLSIQLIDRGILNTNAGPDFDQVCVVIDNLKWVGSAEVHIKASDWYVHRHSEDDAYSNVVLHVVFEHDSKTTPMLPTLELKGRISEEVILQWEQMKASIKPFACGAQLPYLPSVRVQMMKDRAVFERLQQRALRILELLKHENGDWEQTTWRILASAFGFQLNKQAFDQTAASLPIRVLLKLRDHLPGIEALLFGQSGLIKLYAQADGYPEQLAKEYRFQQKRLQIEPANQLIVWKFGKMRPPMFPTVKLAQLAQMVSSYGNLFHLIRDVEECDVWQRILEVNPSEYWRYHYAPQKTALKPIHVIGQTYTGLIIINAIVPLLAAYAQYTQDDRYMERAVRFLEHLPSESNKYLKAWSEHGVKAHNALDSQALIEQFNSHCIPRDCLNCSIGSYILSEYVV